MASLSPTHPREIVVRDGARHITVPARTAIDEPILIDIDLGATDLIPATRVIVGEGARVSIVERLHGSAPGEVALACTIVAEARADVTYTVVQTAGPGTVVVDRQAELAGDARMVWNLALLGSAAARERCVTSANAVGASAEVAALFFPVAREQIELTTEVRHEVGPTTSTTVVRGIAAGRGRGRYFGNIHIAPHAHGVDASLRDDSLLFGSTAKIDAIPALEIAANDVKAFHGATAGSIDEEHLFYLMSRGIERGAAEKLIALGFFEPALERFPGDALRDEIRTVLEGKLAGAHA